MATAIRGRLITAAFADGLLRKLPGAATPPDHVMAAIDAWAHVRESSVGPASSVRTIADVVVIPLLKLLGFSIEARFDRGESCLLRASSGASTIPVIVVAWDEPLRGTWREAVLGAVRADGRWACCCNGRALRIVDAQRTWSREHLEFDLDLLAHDATAMQLLWSVVRAEAFAAPRPLLDTAAALSARQGVAICRALGDGMIDALSMLLAAHAGRRIDPADGFEQSLTLLYRILFLLFAEARGLVPIWHPVYRARYTIDSIVTTLLEGRPCRGLWQAVTAISRLAHAGCSAGELKVTAFNGRLFAPARASALAATALTDRVMERAVLAVSTTPAPGGRLRISYRDLDVEQLGAVYERVLDYEGDARKSTASFYTPRAVTDHLVRRTLEPLVAKRDSRGILSLRVVDPAMGSGAFLVSACRYLAEAVEHARIREGTWHPSDVTAADRAGLRREIAQRCLFGVDLNPMAVQLARLSLWLATLAADKPLTFLDHRLVAGNSLLGATFADVRRRPGRTRSPSRERAPLPLFDDEEVSPVLEHASRVRLQLASEPDDEAAVVHRKEQALAALNAREAPLAAWSRVFDLWCARWFWQRGSPPDAGVFGEISRHLLRRSCALPQRIAGEIADHADALARRHRFLHWPLAFPEVFSDDDGLPLANPGFDAVIGNPPWDMVRGDTGDGAVRSARRADARQLTDFVRDAGIYRVAARSHVNRYQLFVERALQLTRRGGRIGLVLPVGVVSDTGSAALRRHLFDRAEVDAVSGLDNRHGIFPIHRGLRFVLLAATTGTPTSRIACRFGVTRVEELDTGAPLLLTRRFLERLSGEEDLGVPELLTPRDLEIVEKITAAIPRLDAADGWHVRFGRELNATDDRGAFVPFRGGTRARAVIEGKQLTPFRVDPSTSRYALPSGAPLSASVPQRPRLAYRDVASATNRLTLIAAIVPAACVTTHTLFCLKTPLPLDAQHVLCALLNSFVANYLIRLRVNTHVTTALMSRLPVPVVRPRTLLFDRLASIARSLSRGGGSIEEEEAYIELQALVPALYQLSPEDFEHIVGTFPQIPVTARAKALAMFRASDEGGR